MAFGDPYTAGTVSVANGSPNVVGVGTLWSIVLVAGDFFCAGGLMVPIAEIVDDTHFTLQYDWPGTTLTDADYVVNEMSPTRYTVADNTGRQRELLETLAIFKNAVPRVRINGFATAPGDDDPVGTVHLVNVGGTDEYAGHDDQFAIRQNTGLLFTVPSEGWEAFDMSTKLPYVWSGLNWNRVAGNYDLPVFVTGRPAAGEVVWEMELVGPLNISAGLPGTRGRARTASTASKVFSIQKNDVEIATATFAIGGTIPTFAMASDLNAVAGDFIRVVAPAVQDATLANITMTIHGTT